VPRPKIPGTFTFFQAERSSRTAKIPAITRKKRPRITKRPFFGGLVKRRPGRRTALSAGVATRPLRPSS